MPVLDRKKMLEVFEQKAKVKDFLSSFFKTKDDYITDTETVEIDVIRNNEKIAVDVVRGTGGFHNDLTKFTTKEYAPPSYDEYTSLTGKQLRKRLPGVNPYSMTPTQKAAYMALITDWQAKLWEKILRAIEFQASQVFFSGQIPLVNGDSLNYKQKASHQIDASPAWTDAAAKPFINLENGCIVNDQDGKTKTVMAIYGRLAWQYLTSIPDFEKKANFRRVDLVNITRAGINDKGAVFHGTIKAGSYVLECWTYPQKYDVPTDAELGLPSGTVSNAGTTQPYVPDTKVLLMGEDLDLRLVYAALEPMFDDRQSGVPVPTQVRGKRQVYTDVGKNKRTLIVGVESAPLCIPTQIDGFCWIDVTP